MQIEYFELILDEKIMEWSFYVEVSILDTARYIIIFLFELESADLQLLFVRSIRASAKTLARTVWEDQGKHTKLQR